MCFFFHSWQSYLKDQDQQLVSAFRAELLQVKTMFEELVESPPLHVNMPPVVCKLVWVHGLKERIQVSAQTQSSSVSCAHNSKFMELYSVFGGLLTMC